MGRIIHLFPPNALHLVVVRKVQSTKVYTLHNPDMASEATSQAGADDVWYRQVRLM